MFGLMGAARTAAQPAVAPTPAPGDTRVTTTGDVRTTSTGDTRTTG